MLISSSGIIDGIIQNRFGKFCDDADKLDNVPIRSIPIEWQDLPVATKTIAVVMQDYDAIPVCGFSWIHWLVANIPADESGLIENASREKSILIQGKNSLASKQICGEMSEEITNFYGGPRPPDQDHEYEITCYALDTVLDLQFGFRLNELLRKMRGHILESKSIYGKYPAKI